MKNEPLSVFVTVPTRDEAWSIARTVVEEKLAACANIMPGLQSIFFWEGKLEQAEECAIVLKTMSDKYEALQSRIAELHSYECPCIVAMPIAMAHADYLNWVERSVAA